MLFLVYNIYTFRRFSNVIKNSHYENSKSKLLNSKYLVNFFKRASKNAFLFILVYNLKCFFIPLPTIIIIMPKNYLYTITLLIFFFTMSASAQDVKQQSKGQEASSIEGLNLYPNPVSNGKVYITSKNDLDKGVIIFDVLGKKTLQTTISSKELNIANLSPGVYIIKINEGEATATRKLIVK